MKLQSTHSYLSYLPRKREEAKLIYKCVDYKRFSTKRYLSTLMQRPEWLKSAIVFRRDFLHCDVTKLVIFRTNVHFGAVDGEIFEYLRNRYNVISC